MLKRTLLAGGIAAALAIPALAHHDGDVSTLPGIAVSHAHTAAVSASAHAIEVYMTIENTGGDPVRLTGAEVDFAEDGIFQAPSVAEDGTMSVREVSAVEIAPRQTVTFQPGGLHVVFNDVQDRFAAGDRFEARLEFADRGDLRIEVAVEAGQPRVGDDLS